MKEKANCKDGCIYCNVRYYKDVIKEAWCRKYQVWLYIKDGKIKICRDCKNTK